MKVLLDTHAFLWWISDSPKLSALAREVMSDGNNVLYFSAASGWEIAIKAQLGRLQLPNDLKSFIPEQPGSPDLVDNELSKHLFLIVTLLILFGCLIIKRRM